MSIQTANAKITTVADSATSITILDKSTSRRGAVIHNQSAEILYLRLGGGTAAITAGNFSVKLAAAGGEYEVPFHFKGAISGIWASGSTGYCNVTVFS